MTKGNSTVESTPYTAVYPSVPLTCNTTIYTTVKTIFLSTGKTFTFRGVENVVENETSLTFDYTAMSDGLIKTVVFYRPGMVGHSTYTYETG
jgi:hypothetical protein